MVVFQILLAVATVLCSLVAGFLFAFATVVMPGTKNLDDGAFLRAFQVIDGVIQKNQPLFMLMWIGSVLSLIAAAALGAWKLAGLDRMLLVLAALIFVLGVQVPTATINIPLNNAVQALDTKTMSQTDLRRARDDFESRWNQWNAIRTVLAIVVTVLLIALLLRL
jgi:uncharacterized membrane protein